MIVSIMQIFVKALPAPQENTENHKKWPSDCPKGAIFRSTLNEGSALGLFVWTSTMLYCGFHPMQGNTRKVATWWLLVCFFVRR